jgi:hypothetical protein
MWPRAASGMSHSGGPRTGAMVGGRIGSPRWVRIARTVLHFGCAKRAQQRKDFVDAGEELRPGVAGVTPRCRWCRWRIGDPCCMGWHGDHRGHRLPQRRIGRQHTVVAMAMDPRRRHERGEALEQFGRGQP